MHKKTMSFSKSKWKSKSYIYTVYVFNAKLKYYKNVFQRPLICLHNLQEFLPKDVATTVSSHFVGQWDWVQYLSHHIPPPIPPHPSQVQEALDTRPALTQGPAISSKHGLLYQIWGDQEIKCRIEVRSSK